MFPANTQLRALAAAISLLAVTAPAAEVTYRDFELPPHNYKQRTPRDRFTLLKADLESGKLSFDRTSEKAFLLGALKALEIPATTQMLVFSTTSLQLSLINPSNPRAIYFNDDAYLSFIPGGRIEIVAIDPELGGIFYIFDIPREARPPRVERSERCMNCHANDATGGVPGVVVKSVIPGPTGGSLNSFRIDQTGHTIPLDQRFGGWYVTGAGNFTNHWGNIVGRFSPQGLQKNHLTPGRQFDFNRYPVATSDLLPQLVNEHQIGFLNRVIEAGYRTRTILHRSPGGALTREQTDELEAQARLLTRYILFADEAPLPAGGVAGDPAFKADFLRDRRVAGGTASLKDFELQTRIFKYRCSYLIYGNLFQNLPAEIKTRVYRHLAKAIDENASDADFKYLPALEKRAIHSILKATLKDFPAKS
jgi:hypothetical protein